MTNLDSKESQTIIKSECLSYMKTMESNSISAIVTDPPYGLKFMGKDWDHGIPGIEFWKEALRISKPGTWMLAFGGTRTYHRLTCAIEDAGWEIRDCIMWMYGSGFPKGKGCLKPAYEPIILTRKPGCKVSENFLNIDECRISVSKEDAKSMERVNTPGSDRFKCGKFGSSGKDGFGDKNHPYDTSIGRWPANVILDEESGAMLDEQTGILASRFFYCAKASSSERNAGLEGMPLKESVYSKNNKSGEGCRMSDSCIPKANNHPTVKPIRLMEYLIKLIMPSSGILLDPFAGSGTTILAAKRLGVEAIGIELNEEYCEIARNRLSSFKPDPQMDLFHDQS